MWIETHRIVRAISFWSCIDEIGFFMAKFGTKSQDHHLKSDVRIWPFLSMFHTQFLIISTFNKRDQLF